MPQSNGENNQRDIGESPHDDQGIGSGRSRRSSASEAPIGSHSGFRQEEPRDLVGQDDQMAQPNPNPDTVTPGKELIEFLNARRMVVAAQVMAAVSLIIGGVVLSSAAFIVAVIGYRQVSKKLASAGPSVDKRWLLLKRSATVAIVAAIAALVFNAVVLIVVFPELVQMLQSGEYWSYLNGGEARHAQPGSTSSVWG